MSRTWLGPRFFLAFFLIGSLIGCTSPAGYLAEADRVAGDIILQKQKAALGETEPFTIESAEDALRKRLLVDQDLPVSHPASLGRNQLEPIPHWPETEGKIAPPRIYFPELTEGSGGPLGISLQQALEIAAASSPLFQAQKERVFQTALALDLERNTFRNIFSAGAESEFDVDPGSQGTVSGSRNAATASVTRTLQSGVAFSTQFAMDLVKLLTAERPSSLGILADASISIPLWRGAGEHIVSEPLIQAERNVIYAIWEFERFKRTFAVDTASRYLGVLRQLDQVNNAEDNYRRLIASTRRARRLADAGRLPEIQVDQAVQDELRARDRWISARQSYARALDNFKVFLALPPDARILLDRSELQTLADMARQRISEGLENKTAADEPVPPADAPIDLKEPDKDQAGPYEFSEQDAILLALANRLDLRVSQEQVYDAQRQVVVAADALEGELTLFGAASAGERRSLGSAGFPNAELRPEHGFYSALLSVDLPLERTAERNAFRNSFIALEERIRDFQGLEDQVKIEIRNRLRDLVEFREALQIQAQAVRVAQRRVESTTLFLQAGRAEIRDLLEAQEALVSARNALTTALVNYRIAELELQRDMGVLKVNERGLWTEYAGRTDVNHGS